MKRLICVRHGRCGNYDGGKDHLYDTSKVYLAEQTGKIRHYVPDGSSLIISSTTLRAKESAEIIARGFSCDIEESELIGSYYYKDDDIPKALELIPLFAKRADNIILVTHSEYTTLLPTLFSLQNLSARFAPVNLSEGQAWIIDIETETIRIIK